MTEHDDDPSAQGPSLRELLAETREVVEEVDESAEDYAARRQADDRSKIAHVIVYLFAGLVSVFFAFVILEPHFTETSSEASSLMLDALKTLVLPILTLVLGYYFGSTKQ